MSEAKSSSLPPDRGHLPTEQQHAGSRELDTLSSQAMIELFARDHRQVIAAVQAARVALATFIDNLVGRVRDGGRLIYVGAGTSGRLGVLDASECPPTFMCDPGRVVGIIAGGDRALRQSSESMEDDRNGCEPEFDRIQLNSSDTVLGIAAGGTTPFVLGAIELAGRRNCMTGLLTCATIDCPPACDHLIVLDTGAELLTGSTRLKAGSATKLALNIISTALFVQLGKTLGNLMVDLRATNNKLRDRAIRILMAVNEIDVQSRDDAADLLDRADGQVKPAIVMHLLNFALDDANQMLAEYDGSLRAVIERLRT